MKQEHKKGEKNRIGAFGEQITVNYLKRNDFTIVATNYLKKWGEIDIIAKDSTGNIRFVEVKTISYATKDRLIRSSSRSDHRPEENVHFRKIQRLHRAIQSWIIENHFEGEWQIDVASVRVVPREKYATIKYLPNVML